MTELELAAADVWATGISPDSYPTQFLREDLDAIGVVPADQLLAVPDGTRVLVAGAVTHRQRPATAQGVTFINLEDETGMVNVLCSPGVWARHRRLAQTASALLIRGQVQNATGAVTVVADRMGKLSMTVGLEESATSVERAAGISARSPTAEWRPVGVVQTFSTLIFSRVLYAARNSLLIPMRLAYSPYFARYVLVRDRIGIVRVDRRLTTDNDDPAAVAVGVQVQAHPRMSLDVPDLRGVRHRVHDRLLCRRSRTTQPRDGLAGLRDRRQPPVLIG